MEKLQKVMKFLPYAFVLLGILGASVGKSGNNYAGEVCCGIITILALFYVVAKDLK